MWKAAPWREILREMSEENVEIARATYEQFARGDLIRSELFPERNLASEAAGLSE